MLDKYNNPDCIRALLSIIFDASSSTKLPCTCKSDDIRTSLTKFACGVIQLAATDGCRWWQIDSALSRPTSSTDQTPIVLGSIRTLISSTKARERATVWLVSTEPLKFSDDTFTKVTDIYCNHMPSTEKLNINIYTPINTQ